MDNEVNEFEVALEQMSAEISAMARGKAIVVAKLASAEARAGALSQKVRELEALQGTEPEATS